MAALTSIASRTASRVVTPDLEEIDLSVVVPAYNEEGAVGSTVAQINDTLSKLPIRFEIIVVDDGSTDGTRREAERTGARVIASTQNDGYGGALKRGIAASHSKLVAILDADGTYPPASLVQMIEIAEAADMVVGDRGPAMRNVSLVRRPAKWILGALAAFLVGRRIPDINSGLRVFRRESLQKFIPLLPDGFSFTTTITLCMLCTKMRVEYLPISYGKRVGHSKIRPAHFLTFLVLLLRIIVLFRPLRFFMPLGALLFMLGLAKAAYDITKMNLSESAIFGLLAALIIWSLGLVADMISRLHLRP
jgi:glycosyltransferase involved in cell wall biosynthesis